MPRGAQRAVVAPWAATCAATPEVWPSAGHPPGFRGSHRQAGAGGRRLRNPLVKAGRTDSMGSMQHMPTDKLSFWDGVLRMHRLLSPCN